MNKTISMGLLLVAVGCGQQGMENATEPTQKAKSAVQTAAPSQGTATTPKGGCMNDRFPNEHVPSPQDVSKVDDSYRKDGAKSEAKKLAALEQAQRENPTPAPQSLVADPPADPKLLERQAQYLKALEELGVEHQHRYGAAYEKERVALKERIFSDD